jgi:hypothetical protein
MLGVAMAATPGWYPDPSEPARHRYFDGAVWTENYYYATTAAPMYGPPPIDRTREQQRPAGWYPDPDAPTRRRYWEGQRWTNHYTEAEITYSWALNWPALVVVAVVAVLAIIGAALDDNHAFLGSVMLFVVIGGGLLLAFRSDARRKQRQKVQDRNIELAIHADIEHDAYHRGDDQRGVHGQFPPAS